MKEIGPRERQLREQREARYLAEQARQKTEAKKVPDPVKATVPELRESVAKIVPKPKKAKVVKKKRNRK